jgi:hypothetical protein
MQLWRVLIRISIRSDDRRWRRRATVQMLAARVVFGPLPDAGIMQYISCVILRVFSPVEVVVSFPKQTRHVFVFHGRTMVLFVGSVALAAGLGSGACSSPGNPVEPRARAVIRVVTPINAQDTVQTRFPLSLEVTLADGSPAAAWILEFRGLPRDEPGIPASDVSVYALQPGADPFTPEDYLDWSTGGTNTQGQARIWIQLGPRPGKARLEIRAQDGTRDTVHFVLLPGKASGARIFQSDTALYVGRSLPMNTSVVDRLGNPRNEPVTLSTLTPDVTLSGSIATAVSYGLSGVVATAGTGSDTVRISVVPQGTLAAASPDGVYMFGLDGTGLRLVILAEHLALNWAMWSPDGREIVAGAKTGLELLTVSNGSVRNVGAGAAGEYLGAKWAPQYSPDGQWIYFTGTAVSPDSRPPPQLLRVRPNDSQLGPVPGIPDISARYPAPSPDGVHLLYASSYDSADVILEGPAKILNLQTGAVATIGFPVHAPRWSPAGNQIAYLDYFDSHDERGSLKVMDPQGTGVKTLGAATSRYWYGMDWSPDGQWIVIANRNTQDLDLIHAASGQVIPLPAYTRYMRSPTWKP